MTTNRNERLGQNVIAKTMLLPVLQNKPQSTPMNEELWLILVKYGYSVGAADEEENDYVEDFHPYNHKGEFVGDFLKDLGFKEADLPAPDPAERVTVYQNGPGKSGPLH